MWDEFWGESALCRRVDPDALFVRGALQKDATRVCRACPVRTECLSEALDGRVEYGVWGGMTERDRRALLRRRPDVTSWRELLDASRNVIANPATAARASRTAAGLSAIRQPVGPPTLARRGTATRVPSARTRGLRVADRGDAETPAARAS